MGPRTARSATRAADLLRVADALGTRERGRYLVAATFGNVHGTNAGRPPDLSPGILRDGKAALAASDPAARFDDVFHGASGTPEATVREVVAAGVVKLTGSAGRTLAARRGCRLPPAAGRHRRGSADAPKRSPPRRAADLCPEGGTPRRAEPGSPPPGSPTTPASRRPSTSPRRSPSTSRGAPTTPARTSPSQKEDNPRLTAPGRRGEPPWPIHAGCGMRRTPRRGCTG